MVGVIYRLSVLVVCLFLFLVGYVMFFFNMVDVVIVVYNFWDYSGIVVGIMKVNNLIFFIYIFM